MHQGGEPCGGDETQGPLRRPRYAATVEIISIGRRPRSLGETKPPVAVVASEPAPSASHEQLLWAQRAIWLARATIAWNVLEGIVAMAFGVADESVALFGFGVDSWIEVGSASVVLWRLSRPAGCETTRRSLERRATRWISALFLLLGSTTCLAAGWQLHSGGHPESTISAVVVSVVSLSVMFGLWRAKTAAAAALGSSTLAMDAACSWACIQLSAVLLAGALLFAAFPALWWADAAAALVLGALITREGWAGLSAASREDFQGGCGCSGAGNAAT